VQDKLRAGARVAGIGCGLGASTLLLAQEYPNSRFTGSDYHDQSIEIARKRAADAGVADRISFEVASAAGFSRRRLRPGRRVRLPARHGRSARRRPA
jgi:ubiquinone/menaquinone biosynthesis C-methylase UbiE